MNDNEKKLIVDWLVQNGFKLRHQARRYEYEFVQGAGPGVYIESERPTRLRCGPYVVRVTENTVFESHIFDDGLRGLLYQSWVDIGTHPYSTQEGLKAILDKLTTKPATCWNEGVKS